MKKACNKISKPGKDIYPINAGLIVILVLVIIAGIAFIALNFNKIAEHEEQIENTENITEEITFVRTYNIVSDLQRTDSSGQYKYYVIDQFQMDNPIVIKVESSYNLNENENYEFTFEGTKTEGKEYTIQEIFDNFKIVDIQSTDKEGLEQRQDVI